MKSRKAKPSAKSAGASKQGELNQQQGIISPPDVSLQTLMIPFLSSVEKIISPPPVSTEGDKHIILAVDKFDIAMKHYTIQFINGVDHLDSGYDLVSITQQSREKTGTESEQPSIQPNETDSSSQQSAHPTIQTPTHINNTNSQPDGIQDRPPVNTEGAIQTGDKPPQDDTENRPVPPPAPPDAGNEPLQQDTHQPPSQEQTDMNSDDMGDQHHAMDESTPANHKNIANSSSGAHDSTTTTHPTPTTISLNTIDEGLLQDESLVKYIDKIPFPIGLPTSLYTITAIPILLASFDHLTQRVTEVLQRDHFKQKDLAKLIGVSSSTLSPLLRGKYKHTNRTHILRLKEWLFDRERLFVTAVVSVCIVSGSNQEMLAKDVNLPNTDIQAWLSMAIPITERKAVDTAVLSWVYTTTTRVIGNNPNIHHNTIISPNTSFHGGIGSAELDAVSGVPGGLPPIYPQFQGRTGSGGVGVGGSLHPQNGIYNDPYANHMGVSTYYQGHPPAAQTHHQEGEQQQDIRRPSTRQTSILAAAAAEQSATTHHQQQQYHQSFPHQIGGNGSGRRHHAHHPSQGMYDINPSATHGNDYRDDNGYIDDDNHGNDHDDQDHNAFGLPYSTGSRSHHRKQPSYSHSHSHDELFKSQHPMTRSARLQEELRKATPSIRPNHGQQDMENDEIDKSTGYGYHSMLDSSRRYQSTNNSNSNHIHQQYRQQQQQQYGHDQNTFYNPMSIAAVQQSQPPASLLSSFSQPLPLHSLTSLPQTAYTPYIHTHAQQHAIRQGAVAALQSSMTSSSDHSIDSLSALQQQQQQQQQQPQFLLSSQQLRVLPHNHTTTAALPRLTVPSASHPHPIKGQGDVSVSQSTTSTSAKPAGHTLRSPLGAHGPESSQQQQQHHPMVTMTATSQPFPQPTSGVPSQSSDISSTTTTLTATASPNAMLHTTTATTNHAIPSAAQPQSTKSTAALPRDILSQADSFLTKYSIDTLSFDPFALKSRPNAIPTIFPSQLLDSMTMAKQPATTTTTTAPGVTTSLTSSTSGMGEADRTTTAFTANTSIKPTQQQQPVMVISPRTATLLQQQQQQKGGHQQDITASGFHSNIGLGTYHHIPHLQNTISPTSHQNTALTTSLSSKISGVAADPTNVKDKSGHKHYHQRNGSTNQPGDNLFKSNMMSFQPSMATGTAPSVVGHRQKPTQHQQQQVLNSNQYLLSPNAHRGGDAAPSSSLSGTNQIPGNKILFGNNALQLSTSASDGPGHGQNPTITTGISSLPAIPGMTSSANLATGAPAWSLQLTGLTGSGPVPQPQPHPTAATTTATTTTQLMSSFPDYLNPHQAQINTQHQHSIQQSSAIQQRLGGAPPLGPLGGTSGLTTSGSAQARNRANGGVRMPPPSSLLFSGQFDNS